MVIMSPTKPRTGRRNAVIGGQLYNWTKSDGTGLSFDSNSLFTLPNGAKRSPDASWISKKRWRHLSDEERDSFCPICPDFVIELRSASDRLKNLKEKMEEYIANGARLGWLLDPFNRCAYIYRPNQPPEKVRNPARIGGDPVLPGFDFDFTEIVE